MGMLDMSPLDAISKVMGFSQRSLENTLGTIEEVHQKLAEIPINIAQEFGLPEEQAAALKSTHRRILGHVHEGVRDACGAVNRYVVEQAREVNELANYSPRPAEPKLLKLDRTPERRQGSRAG